MWTPDSSFVSQIPFHAPTVVLELPFSKGTFPPVHSARLVSLSTGPNLALTILFPARLAWNRSWAPTGNDWLRVLTKDECDFYVLKSERLLKLCRGEWQFLGGRRQSSKVAGQSDTQSKSPPGFGAGAVQQNNVERNLKNYRTTTEASRTTGNSQPAAAAETNRKKKFFTHDSRHLFWGS